MKVELAILNYNGRHHLEHLLPTAIREAERYGPDCRVVLVDNLSSSDDAAWVRKNFPSVEVWLAPKNEYLFSYNEYAKQTTSEILVFLNNDFIFLHRMFFLWGRLQWIGRKESLLVARLF